MKMSRKKLMKCATSPKDRKKLLKGISNKEADQMSEEVLNIYKDRIRHILLPEDNLMFLLDKLSDKDPALSERVSNTLVEFSAYDDQQSKKKLEMLIDGFAAFIPK